MTSRRLKASVFAFVALLCCLASLISARPTSTYSTAVSTPVRTTAYSYDSAVNTPAVILGGGLDGAAARTPIRMPATVPASELSTVKAIGVAAETGFNAGIDATKLNMTRTVESHIGEYAKDGTLARPYADSRLTMQNVMDSVKPTADPGGVPGALRWDAPGTMNGSNGTWELVVDPSTNTVLHFMFRGAH